MNVLVISLKDRVKKPLDAKVLMKKYLNRNFENIKDVIDNRLSEVYSFFDSTCIFCSGSLLQTLENMKYLFMRN